MRRNPELPRPPEFAREAGKATRTIPNPEHRDKRGGRSPMAILIDSMAIAVNLSSASFMHADRVLSKRVSHNSKRASSHFIVRLR